jgi:hypothetical protein
MKKCKICGKVKTMQKLVDKKYRIYDTRHSFCFKCRPTLGEEGQGPDETNFIKQNKQAIYIDHSKL